MSTAAPVLPDIHREQLVHALYEAAELEHNLMCTYLYAAYSLKNPGEGGLSGAQSAAVTRWRGEILSVAIEEMVHLAQVWNVTLALGAAPRIGRANFPLDPGYLPASVVVKLAPFTPATLQHFVHLERPHGSAEPDGEGFAAERAFTRARPGAWLTPMAVDYDTVGDFYQALSDGLRALCAREGEANVFRGDARLQLAGATVGLADVRPVKCLATAQVAFDAIVAQGEGARTESTRSHYQRFVAIRAEFHALQAADPGFVPAWPAATNPVLRRPPRPEGRVWIEDEQASALVDLANAAYGLMLRLLAYACAVPQTEPAKAATLQLAVGLMRAVAPLAMAAARRPAGPANPGCHAGMSFTTLRDAGAWPVGRAAEAFFVDRLASFAGAARGLVARGIEGAEPAAEAFAALATSAARAFPAPAAASAAPAASPGVAAAAAPPAPEVERVAGEALEIRFRARRCIHARFCVTGAPAVFLANVQGAWIKPDAMPVERLVEIAHACPSGAIQYSRRDGRPDESAPPVNLATVREAGPYSLRGPLTIDGEPIGFRATLCRCGASANKPYCDGSHHAVGFAASGEPPTTAADALATRDGPLAIEPQRDGPLGIRGALEIVSGTGRVVARVTEARLCRCGGSGSKPFCDGTHARIGFRS